MDALLDVRPLHACSLHRGAVPDFFGKIARLNREGAWRSIYANPTTGEVRYATDADGTLLQEVHWYAGEPGPDHSWAESGLTIFHTYESAHSLDSCHYEWWLTEYKVSGPCLIGYQPITDPGNKTADRGWAFMVREA